MRHLTRPGHRHPAFIVDPDTGRSWPIPAGGADDDPPPDPNSPPSPDPNVPPADPPAADDKKLTQAEFDAALAKRLNTAKTQWEKEAKDQADRAKMDEVERLKAEKADADKASQAAAEAANARIIKADAKVAAVAAGAKPEQASYVVKLADLSGVEVDDDGNPDEAAIRKAIEKVLTDVPALKGVAGPGKSGGELGGGAAEKKPASIADAVNARYA